MRATINVAGIMVTYGFALMALPDGLPVLRLLLPKQAMTMDSSIPGKRRVRWSVVNHWNFTKTLSAILTGTW